MNVDEITYGNPSIEQLPHLENKTYADSLFPELVTFTFPKNSSEATREELNVIVDCLNNLSGNDEHLKRYRMYDVSLSRYFKEGLEKSGHNKEEAAELVDSIIKDTLPLLTKLKYYFQRPRPYQLAEYYKLKLFPYNSYSSNTPSFPSGHAFQARLLTEVIGNIYPSTHSVMKDLFNDICYSRLYLGFHYQSDIDVGIFCAEKVLEMDEFKIKYKL
jgi:hypothetical protein